MYPYPQQSLGGSGPSDSFPTAGGPVGYQPPPSYGHPGQALPYPLQSQQQPPLQQLQQHDQQQFQQQQLLMGQDLSPEMQQQQQQQQQQVSPQPGPEPGPATAVGALKPPGKAGGFLNFFARQKLAGGSQASAPPAPGSAQPSVPVGATAQASPPPAAATGSLPQPGGAPPPVPVVAAASGWCSKATPPAEEPAHQQNGPLFPSKFALPNQAPAEMTGVANNSSVGAGRATSGGGAAGGGGVGLRFRRLSTPSSSPAVDPQFSGPPPLEDMYGPCLRYAGYDSATHIYTASVMMVIHQTRSPFAPTLKYHDVRGSFPREELRNPIRLFSYSGYNFWRWDLSIQLGRFPNIIVYHVVCSKDHIFSLHNRYQFHLPALGQKWHWGFYSCNGFHDHDDDVRNRGIEPLWSDVLHQHRRDPLHVMFGGGDQLYCDDVWKVESLLQWTLIKDKPSRNAQPFNQQMVNEVFDFYFRNYTGHFSRPGFREALCSIPQVMVWDDHDIFDGWGSYPVELQTCPVFSGVFFVARKFYLLFQCHAAEDNYRELNKGWGLTGLSWTVMMGDTTAVVGLDTRGERTRDRIVRPASWAAFSDQIAKLPAGVRHVVMVVAVPLVYPTVPGVEDAMMALAGTGLMGCALTALLQKTGLSSQIYSQFGEPELLDDLLDHWSAKNHKEEKYYFVRMMQDLAKARSIRFSILSGDVHCAGVAAFQSLPKVKLTEDHRYMVQVISSAIGNIPPPEGVIKALTMSNKPGMLDEVTREKMRGIFENSQLLKAARNWCDVHEWPLGSSGAPLSSLIPGSSAGGRMDGALVFQLRVEHPVCKEVRPDTYDIEVPVLQLPDGTYSWGPLREAPQLPEPLLQLFNKELIEAGVGLGAARPLSSGAFGSLAGATAASSAAAASAAAVATQMAEQLNISGGLPPALPPQQVPLAAPPAAYGDVHGYGLQTDISQHQNQQPPAYGLSSAQPLSAVQAAGSYRATSMLPTGAYQPHLPHPAHGSQLQTMPSSSSYGVVQMPQQMPSASMPAGKPWAFYPPAASTLPQQQQPAYPPQQQQMYPLQQQQELYPPQQQQQVYPPQQQQQVYPPQQQQQVFPPQQHQQVYPPQQHQQQQQLYPPQQQQPVYPPQQQQQVYPPQQHQQQQQLYPPQQQQQVYPPQQHQQQQQLYPPQQQQPMYPPQQQQQQPMYPPQQQNMTPQQAPATYYSSPYAGAAETFPYSSQGMAPTHTQSGINYVPGYM